MNLVWTFALLGVIIKPEMSRTSYLEGGITVTNYVLPAGSGMCVLAVWSISAWCTI